MRLLNYSLVSTLTKGSRKLTLALKKTNDINAEKEYRIKKLLVMDNFSIISTGHQLVKKAQMNLEM